MNQNESVTEHKANKALRFINLLIDLPVVLFIIVILFCIIAVIIYAINPESNFFYKLENMSSFLDQIISSAIYFLIYAGLEILTKGRSIGKYITGTKVIMIDGTEPTRNDYFKRNLCRIIPFDAVSFLFKNGWHDKFSNTTVVRKKTFEESLLTNNSINEIGN